MRAGTKNLKIADIENMRRATISTAPQFQVREDSSRSASERDKLNTKKMVKFVEYLLVPSSFSQYSVVQNILITTLSGYLAGGIVISLFFPLEFLECVLQLGMYSSDSLKDTIKTVYSTAGIRGFYTGYKASIFG